jgi:hypothetical protein
MTVEQAMTVLAAICAAVMGVGVLLAAKGDPS